MHRGLFIEGFAPARTTKIFEFSLAKLKGHDLRGSVPSFLAVSSQPLALSFSLPNFSWDHSTAAETTSRSGPTHVLQSQTQSAHIKLWDSYQGIASAMPKKRKQLAPLGAVFACANYPTDAVAGSSTPASRKNRAASSGGVGLI